jgi:hypothetical protein
VHQLHDNFCALPLKPWGNERKIGEPAPASTVSLVYWALLRQETRHFPSEILCCAARPNCLANG